MNQLESIVEDVILNQDIKAMNKRLIEAAIKLYAEKTHFVYELLQNAEDVGATHVRFTQYNDRLEVIHNGEPFTQSNLQSLCDAAKSDKQDQIDKIGKFGIGFKSVFAICDKVMLYTEPENRQIEEETLPRMAVRIDDYISPTLLYEDWSLDAPYTTKFVFPYDVKMYKKPVEDLKIDVAKKLRDLGADVLLFMKNIQQIEYQIIGISQELDGGNIYRLDRESLGERIYRIKTHGNTGRKESDNLYLIFSKNIDIDDSKRTVDIAFSITEKDGKVRFNKALSPYISMYFPTETESKLNFIVQAPFDLTSNRSSLEEGSKHNEKLKVLLMNLYIEVIFEMKNRNWLTLELINLLPYDIDDREFLSMSWPFRSLHTKTFDMLDHEAIIPASDGSYVTAKDAKIARSAKLTELFSGQKLDLLLGSKGAKWLATDFTENSPLRALHRFFTRLLRVEEITSSDLSRLIRSNSLLLKNVDNKWLSEFYGYLAKDVKNLLGKNGDLATVPFVKTSDGNFNAPIVHIRNGRRLEPKDNIFIRPKNSTYDVEGFLFIDDWVFNNCPDFVDALGLPQPDGYMYYKKELEARRGFKPVENDDISSVRQAIKYIREDRDNIREDLAGLIWIKVINPFNGTSYFTTSIDSIYRGRDFNGVSLLDYFSGIKSASPVCILDEKHYIDNGFSELDFGFLEQIGVKDNIYEGIAEQHWRDRPTDYFNNAGFIKNLSFSRISEVLNEITKDYNDKDIPRAGRKSAIVFSLLKNVDKNLIDETGGNVAQILKILGGTNNSKWLITSNGRLTNPSEITPLELDSEFYGRVDSRKETIYELLGFKKTPEDKRAEVINEFVRRFSPEQQEIILSNFAQIQSDEDEGVYDPEVDDEYKDFPEEKVRDPNRLREKTRQKYSDAPAVKYEDVLRKIRTSRDIKRDKSHIKYRYKGYCQLCEEPHHYWEIAGIFGAPSKELQEMNLSLCPACATEYRIMRSNDSLMNAFAREIENTDVEADPSVALGDKYVRFTSTHLAEVQEIIRIDKASKRL